MNPQATSPMPSRSLTSFTLLPTIDLLRIYFCILLRNSLIDLILDVKCSKELWSKTVWKLPSQDSGSRAWLISYNNYMLNTLLPHVRSRVSCLTDLISLLLEKNIRQLRTVYRILCIFVLNEVVHSFTSTSIVHQMYIRGYWSYPRLLLVRSQRTIPDIVKVVSNIAEEDTVVVYIYIYVECYTWNSWRRNEFIPNVSYGHYYTRWWFKRENRHKDNVYFIFSSYFQILFI